MVTIHKQVLHMISGVLSQPTHERVCGTMVREALLVLYSHREALQLPAPNCLVSCPDLTLSRGKGSGDH